MSDLIDRQAAIDAATYGNPQTAWQRIEALPSAQPEIVRCRDCKYWRRQTTSSGAPSWFGFCDSDDMWRSLYGETCEVEHIDTDEDFYCGHAERREE